MYPWSIPEKMYLQRALQSIMQVCISGFVYWRCSVGLKVQDALFNEPIHCWAADSLSIYFYCLGPSTASKQQCLDDGRVPPPSKKVSLFTGCHSVPSIGQRRRFVGDKSGVTIWIFCGRRRATPVRGLFGHHMWLLDARAVYYLFCLFFVLNRNNNDDSWIDSWRC